MLKIQNIVTDGVTGDVCSDDADLGGNPSTIFLLVYALIAGVMGACSVFLGYAHLRIWNDASLASATTSALFSSALTALAFGYSFQLLSS